MTQTLLTGIKPTGTPHLGNYAGAIKPICELARDPTTQSFLLIADGHALNAIRDPEKLRDHVAEVAATYAAFGLTTDRDVLFRQSDVPEIFQLANILACYCAKGLANRAHAYKAAVARNAEEQSDSDAGINMGLFTYPLLMSADILAFHTDLVPVGPDQRQHVELTISLAKSINSAVGQTLRVPNVRIDEATDAIPGLDGRKMSKSYNNTISLFCSREALRKQIRRVRTSSRAPGVPGDSKNCSLFALHNIFASDAQRDAMRREYELGTGYGAIKERVFELCDASLSESRARYQNFLEDRQALAASLSEGAERARRSCTSCACSCSKGGWTELAKFSRRPPLRNSIWIATNSVASWCVRLPVVTGSGSWLSRFLLLVVVCTGGTGIAQELPPDIRPPVPAPAPLPAPSEEPTGPAPLAVTISGGGTLGAYMAGELYYMGLASRTSKLYEPRVFTGASAGSINAFISALTSCSAPQVDPTQSMFWNVWIPSGIREFFPKHHKDGTSLLSPSGFDPGIEYLRGIWDAGLPTDCDVLFGVAITRAKPLDVQLAPGFPAVPRSLETVMLRVRGQGKGKAPLLTNYVDPAKVTPQILLPLSGPKANGFESLRQLTLALLGISHRISPGILTPLSIGPQASV